MKWLALGFTVFIILIIVLADLGLMAGPLELLHRLPMGDKVGHFVLIGILSFLVILSLLFEFPQRDPKRIAVIAALALALVFSIEEASQWPIDGRDASLVDLLANYAGIAVFGWLAWMVNRWRQSKRGA